MAGPGLEASDSLVVLCKRGRGLWGQTGAQCIVCELAGPPGMLHPPRKWARVVHATCVLHTISQLSTDMRGAAQSLCGPSSIAQRRRCYASAPQNSAPEQLPGKPLVSSSAPSMLLGGCHGGPAPVLLRLKLPGTHMCGPLKHFFLLKHPPAGWGALTSRGSRISPASLMAPLRLGSTALASKSALWSPRSTRGCVEGFCPGAAPAGGVSRPCAGAAGSGGAQD